MSRNTEPNAAVGMEPKYKEEDPSEKQQEANSKQTNEQVVLLSPPTNHCDDDVSRENTIFSVAPPVDNYPKESDTVVQQQHNDLWQHPGVELEESNPMRNIALFEVTSSSRLKFRSSMPMLPAKKAYLVSSDNMRTSSAPSKGEAAPTAEVLPRKRKHEYEDVEQLELEENQQREREIRLERNRKTAKARREKKHAEIEEKRQKIAKIVLDNDFLRQSIQSRYQELSDAGVDEDTMKRALSPPSAIKQKMDGTKLQEQNDLLLGVVQNSARKKKDGMLVLSPLSLYNMSAGSSFLDATSPPVYSPSVKGVPGGGRPRQMLLRPEVRTPQQDPFISIDNHKQSIKAQQLLGTGLQQQCQPRRDTLLSSHLFHGQQPHFSPLNQPFEPHCGQDRQRPDDGVVFVQQQQARQQHQIGALERSRRQKVENNNDQREQLFYYQGHIEGKCGETSLLQGFGQQEGSSLQHPTSFHGLNLEQNPKQLGEQIPKVGGNEMCVINQSQEIIEQNMNGNILQQEQQIFDCLRQPQQHEWVQRQIQQDAGLRTQIEHQQDHLRLQEQLQYGGESAQTLRHENNLQIDVKEADRSSILNTGAVSLIRRQEELQGQQQWGTCIKEHEQQTAKEQLQERTPEQIMVLQRQGHPISEDNRERIERGEMAPVLNRSLLAGCCHDHQQQNPWQSNLNPHQRDTNQRHLGIRHVEVEQRPVPRQQDQHQQDVELWSNVERQQFRDFIQRQVEELDREEEGEDGVIQQQYQH